MMETIGLTLAIIMLLSSLIFLSREIVVWYRIRISFESIEEQGAKIIKNRAKSNVEIQSSFEKELQWYMERIEIAIEYANSDDEDKVLSSLQTMSALGTKKLDIVFEPTLQRVEKKWQDNQKVTGAVTYTRQRIQSIGYVEAI